jgi:hypothetical protein
MKLFLVYQLQDIKFRWIFMVDMVKYIMHTTFITPKNYVITIIISEPG